MIDNIRPLSEAVPAYVALLSLTFLGLSANLMCVRYDEFNNMKFHKIVFEADK